MKYIRTKDGAYELLFSKECKISFDHKTTEPAYYSINHEWIAKKDVVKPPADTIEELCDEFVLHYNYTKQASIPIPWATYERRDDNWQKHKEKLISELKNTKRSAIVYGAIWTDKGLIYVAKMNDKGDFELL